MDEMLWSQLHQDILELQVIARLPVCMLFRYRAVCKRWSSPSFLKACFQVEAASLRTRRRPWFYMVPLPSTTTTFTVVYDTELNKWHHVQRPRALNNVERNLKEVASAGGLICFRSSTLGDLMVYNPLTGHGRKLPHMETCEAIRAIAMQRSSCDDSFKILVIHGEMPVFGIKVYDSSRHCWSQLTSLPWNSKESCSEASCLLKRLNINGDDDDIENGVYYLDKDGRVVASREMQYGPSKEFCCVLTSDEGTDQEITIIYFLDRNAKVVACRVQEGLWYELPPLLPSTFEYSVDIVNCGGRLLVVVLVELFESCTVRIWELNEAETQWVQVLAMPPALSHQFYGKNADINCTGYHNFIMICISSHRCHYLVLCNIVENSWQEIPPCYSPGSNVAVIDFFSAFSFEPSLQV